MARALYTEAEARHVPLPPAQGRPRVSHSHASFLGGAPTVPVRVRFRLRRRRRTRAVPGAALPRKEALSLSLPRSVRLRCGCAVGGGRVQGDLLLPEVRGRRGPAIPRRLPCELRPLATGILRSRLGAPCALRSPPSSTHRHRTTRAPFNFSVIFFYAPRARNFGR